MKKQKMNAGKGSSHRSSASASSDRKSKWNPGNKPPSDLKSPTDSKAPKSSSTPKEVLSSAPGPSNLPPQDPVRSAGPGLLPLPGAGVQLPFPDPPGIRPPSPPAYGFHMLERRTIVLADGSVRSYFALPQDYQDFRPPGRPVDLPDRFLPFGGPSGPGSDRGGLGLGLGFDKQFPPDRRLSPDGFRRDRDREEPYRRDGQYDYWNSLGLDGREPAHPEGSLKRKNVDEDERGGRDELAWKRQQLLHYGNLNSNPNGFPSGSGDRADYLGGTSSPFHRDQVDSRRGISDLRSSKVMKVGGEYDDLPSRHGLAGNDVGRSISDVDPLSLKKAFLLYIKSLNENASLKNKYLEDGKHGPLQCLACGRISIDYPDMHDLIMHAYNSVDLRVDHLGLHRALCVLMGWNSAMPPEKSKSYQTLPADDAAAEKDDLILWPPLVIIHNTNSGKGKDKLMEGMGNKAMDNKLRDLGFGGGKSKSLYDEDGHMGITLVKFGADQSGLREAMRLAEFFAKDNHGRRAWAHAAASKQSIKDDEKNPNLVKLDEKTKEKKRIFYGYLATAFDLEKIDVDTKKKIGIESKKELVST